MLPNPMKTTITVTVETSNPDELSHVLATLEGLADVTTRTDETVADEPAAESGEPAPAKRGRGRPKGSPNKPKAPEPVDPTLPGSPQANGVAHAPAEPPPALSLVPPAEPTKAPEPAKAEKPKGPTIEDVRAAVRSTIESGGGLALVEQAFRAVGAESLAVLDKKDYATVIAALTPKGAP